MIDADVSYTEKEQLKLPIKERVIHSRAFKGEKGYLALLRKAVDEAADKGLLNQFGKREQLEFRLDAKQREAIVNVLALQIAQESKGWPDAVSNVGARGLTQFMKRTAKEYGVSHDKLTDPKVSIDLQVRYMFRHMNSVFRAVDKLPERIRDKMNLGHAVRASLLRYHSGTRFTTPRELRKIIDGEVSDKLGPQGKGYARRIMGAVGSDLSTRRPDKDLVEFMNKTDLNYPSTLQELGTSYMDLRTPKALMRPPLADHLIMKEE